MSVATIPTQPGAARERAGREPASSRFSLFNLDQRDTLVLKGLAISAIVLHNFFHRVSPSTENEFSFNRDHFLNLLHTLGDPAHAVQAFFSFFGHFGVQIFIFISAYGLTRSYWDTPSRWTTFMAGRVRKLYPAFFLAVVPWAAAASMELGPRTLLHKEGLEIALMFAGLSTFLPGHGLPPVGPWWFIPFVMQLYAIWFLLRKVTARFGWRGLVLMSLAGLVITRLANPWLGHWEINLFETPLGRMPNICIGIAAARYPLRLNVPVALASAAVLMLGSYYDEVWPLTFVAATIVALWLYLAARPMFRRSELLPMLGHYSLLIFLLNGIVRDQFLPYAKTPDLELAFGFCSGVISVAVSIVLYETLFARSVPKRGRRPEAVCPSENVTVEEADTASS